MNLWRRKRRTSYHTIATFGLFVDLTGALLSPPLPEPALPPDRPESEYALMTSSPVVVSGSGGVDVVVRPATVQAGVSVGTPTITVGAA